MNLSNGEEGNQSREIFHNRPRVTRYNRRMIWKRAILLIVFAAAACSTGVAEPTSTSTDGFLPAAEADDAVVMLTPDVDLEVEIQINKRIDDPNSYSFAQLLPFDGIRPVYDPEFVTAGEAPLQEDELILGITLEGESKAYPITVLRHREMVNDELAGIPILVTW